MWVIFLLSALSVAIIFLIFIYIANKVIIAMKNDREKNRVLNKEFSTEKE